MSEFTQPSDIARETLRRLATRRIPPTPDNYRALYHEIVGTPESESFPEKSLRALAGALPRSTAGQLKFFQQFNGAVSEKNWRAIGNVLQSLLEEAAGEPPAWAGLIHEVVGQLERRHTGVTQGMKREALERVLQSSSSDPKTLFDRLSGLTASWSRAPDSPESALVEAGPATPPPIDGTNADAPSAVSGASASSIEIARPAEGFADLRELVALLLESTTVLIIDTPELAEEAKSLAAIARSAADVPALSSLGKRVKKYAFRLQFVAEDQAEIKQALQNLLMLVIENVSELIADDQWLQGQIAMVLDLFNQPVNVRRLDDVERRLKEVIYKQGILKNSLNEAKERLRSMLAGFVDHLSSFTDSTSDYHYKIDRCATRIGSAKSLAELNDVIEEVMRETRLIQLSAQRSRDDLETMKHRVDEAEQEVERLQLELAQTSELVRHDQLTGALNRKGMNEAFDREQARAARRNSPMCIALLDVDNFKQLNDNFGHQTGDEALIHLARVIRETIRPNDTLARYGGEEFLILLPDTTADDAVIAVKRLQRELTKKFFLADNQKLLITFSAGIAEAKLDEPRSQAFNRADAAMYQAKREGKNRVVAA